MEEAAPPAEPSSKKPRLSAGHGQTAFALRLAKKFAAVQQGSDSHQSQYEKNVIFSPLSIHSALALVAAGARGSTLDEILLLLGAASRDELTEFARTVADRVLTKDGSSEEGAPLVKIASGVWHDQTVALKPAYRAAAVECYNAVTHAADFKKEAVGAREAINGWVSEAMNKLIPSILPQGSVDSSTRLVLANAIYFNGTWSEPFVKRYTANRSFYPLDGSSVDAPFMRSTWDQFVAVHEGFKVLKLPYRMPKHIKNKNPALTLSSPYERPQFSMCIFLPDARDGLPCLMEKMILDPSILASNHLPQRRVKVVQLLLPKFKLSFSSQIDGVLKDMGLKAAFDVQEADLSDMCEGDKPSLSVEKVFHKAVLEVNEEGTEAAASTASILRRCCRVISKVVPVEFVADHPFAFFVVEEASGAVVFAGQVHDPVRSM